MAKRRKRKKRRTAAQKRATRKMLAARRGQLRPKRRKTKRRRKNPMARKKRRRGRRRSSGGGPRVHSLKDKAYVAAGGAVYGYLDNHVEMMEKLPTLGTSRTARNASHGLALHAGASIASGALRKWLDLASVGAFVIAGYNVGKAKGDMASLEGYDDDVERIHLEGEFDPDEDDALEVVEEG